MESLKSIMEELPATSIFATDLRNSTFSLTESASTMTRSCEHFALVKSLWHFSNPFALMTPMIDAEMHSMMSELPLGHASALRVRSVHEDSFAISFHCSERNACNGVGNGYGCFPALFCMMLVHTAKPWSCEQSRVEQLKACAGVGKRTSTSQQSLNSPIYGKRQPMHLSCGPSSS